MRDVRVAAAAWRCLAIILLAAVVVRPTPAWAAEIEPPLFAYYYIWFDPTSWDRAKIDYPLLGRYSSDLASVMRQHVRMAKSAGVDGFIVSWKSTSVLNPRLETLISISEEEDFQLIVIYQGLDFYRDPQPATRVLNDLRYLRDEFTSSPAFEGFGKPVVIWSGTWEFPRGDLARVTDALRDDLSILASERTADEYLQVAEIFDGNAYYWSSVNPATYPGYEAKLEEMSAAAKRYDGLWIAPAAPGFDARLLGGTTVVPRRDGETLRREYDAAVASSPDAIGLISWNEFSENTHIEPSERFGRRYLEVVADIRTQEVEVGLDFDSSAPEGVPAGPERLILLAAYVLGGGLLLAIAARRNAR